MGLRFGKVLRFGCSRVPLRCFFVFVSCHNIIIQIYFLALGHEELIPEEIQYHVYHTNRNGELGSLP